MYRSWSEFNRCATDVFHLFAEPMSDKQHISETCSPSQGFSHVPEKNAAGVGLSYVGLECAFYVLFGRYPAPALLTTCFPSNLRPPSSSEHSSQMQQACIKRNKVICLKEYLRFITVCAEEEGSDFVINTVDARGAKENEPTDEYTTLAKHRDGAKAFELQSWRQFESVAGPKGYIARDDLLHIPLYHPFEDVTALLTASPAAHASPTSPSTQKQLSTPTTFSESSRRQTALPQHVFWILDSNSDGKVQFDDVKPYLLESK